MSATRFEPEGSTSGI